MRRHRLFRREKGVFPFESELLDIASHNISEKIGVEAKIRPIISDDYATLNDICKKCFPYWDSTDDWDISASLKFHNPIGLIIKADNKDVAFLLGEDAKWSSWLPYSAHIDHRTFYSSYAVVLREYRGNGLYTIMDALRNLAVKREGYDRILIHSMTKKDSLGAHLSTGYKKIELIKDHYDTNTHAWLMDKKLTADMLQKERNFILNMRGADDGK